MCCINSPEAYWLSLVFPIVIGIRASTWYISLSQFWLYGTSSKHYNTWRWNSNVHLEIYLNFAHQLLLDILNPWVVIYLLLVLIIINLIKINFTPLGEWKILHVVWNYPQWKVIYMSYLYTHTSHNENEVRRIVYL